MPTGLCHASPGAVGGSARRTARPGRHGRRGRRRLAGPPCRPPAHRVDRDPLGDAPGHRPARDLAGEGVYRGCEVEPPLSCGYAGDAAHLKPVAPARGESALHRVQPGVPARPSSGRGASGSRPFRQARASAWCGARASRSRRCRSFAARGRCAGSRNGPCAARGPRRRNLRAPPSLSGRRTSSGRDTRRNRISRLSSARTPS